MKYYIFYEVDIGDPRGVAGVAMFVECPEGYVTQKLEELKRNGDTILGMVCGYKVDMWNGEEI